MPLKLRILQLTELTLEEWNAQIGLLRGNDTLPDERTEIAGLITFRVAP